MARILIVEDEEANRDVAALICRTAGHDVSLAGDGEEALSLLAAQMFDLVLLDVLMPELDGLGVARAMRASAQWAKVPIIGVTALAGVTEVAAMRAAGMDEVVTKPYRRRTLLDMIDQFLGLDR